MYNVETFGDSWIMVDSRLVVGSNASLSRMFSLMKEMETVDKKYPIVFELAAFAAYQYLPSNMFGVLKKLEVGKYMTYRETKIIKVSASLCVGINLLLEYVYNEEGKTVNEGLLPLKKDMAADEFPDKGDDRARVEHHERLKERPDDDEVEFELV